jgi:hypothetical protein
MATKANVAEHKCQPTMVAIVVVVVVVVVVVAASLARPCAERLSKKKSPDKSSHLPTKHATASVWTGCVANRRPERSERV